MKVPALSLLMLLAAAPASHRFPPPEIAAWERQAQNVTIIRDDWGIAHVYGKTDADAVFGMIYAQAEDDFNRVETNFINSMGRLAEAEGESAVYRDLRMKIFIDPDTMKALYRASPEWLKKLMVAWADGLNFYLAKHPNVTPRVIQRFEPWMALTFSEGSIGGDIESINLQALQAFYGQTGAAPTTPGPDPGPIDQEPRGSNGIAIAPSNTVGKRPLLLINPHTSFFFRSELQMVSEEGLNAYGAVTWGQFFIYQGFNDRSGWMHTSSGVDNIDEYLETVTKKGDGYVYKYGNEERPVIASRISVPYKTATGVAKKDFTVFRTHHGPIVRDANGKWVSVRLMEAPLKALTQSYLRTKAKNLKEYRQTMELHTNSSNNTIFADASGNIAYFHANFIPKRDTQFNWRRPVDGSNPATDWKGVHSLDEEPHVHNPASGWLYNTNNHPWSAAGPQSPRKSNYPRYVDEGSENARGLHAIRVLQGKKDFTIESLRAAAYDSYLTAFDPLLPPLIRDYDGLTATHPLKAALREQIDVLRTWDQRWGVSSVATSLATYWADTLARVVSGLEAAATRATVAQRLQALSDASQHLTRDFGTWKTPWGEINRFQRRTGNIVQQFSDTAPSIPVAFTSARWGSLASFGARTYPRTKRMYGTSGNSFVAVVEFGADSVRAIAITAGGESGHPSSKHFNDQAERYATGNLRPVYFYPNQLEGHIERRYRPGQ
jgi:acyl-homoserine-lactone acylase